MAARRPERFQAEDILMTNSIRVESDRMADEGSSEEEYCRQRRVDRKGHNISYGATEEIKASSPDKEGETADSGNERTPRRAITCKQLHVNNASLVGDRRTSALQREHH